MKKIISWAGLLIISCVLGILSITSISFAEIECWCFFDGAGLKAYLDCERDCKPLGGCGEYYPYFSACFGRSCFSSWFIVCEDPKGTYISHQSEFNCEDCGARED